MHSVFGWLLSDIELYELGVAIIKISMQRFNSSWDHFIPAYFYNLVIWSQKKTLKSVAS